MKTDKRDARALADALTLRAYRVAHRVSAERRHVRGELAVREALVRTRTRYIALAKALVRHDGLRVAGSEAHLVAKRIGALELSDTLAAELLPLFQVLAPINGQIAAADRRIEALTRADPSVALLTSAPSIGPITASGIVSTIDGSRGFGPRTTSKRSSVSSPVNAAPERSAALAASRKPAIRVHATCSSKPAGESCVRQGTTPRRCARGR